MDANVSAQTLHFVVDSDPALHSLSEQLRQSGLSVSGIPAATGVAGLESVLDRDLAGQVFSSISLYSHASQGQLSLGADRIDVRITVISSRFSTSPLATPSTRTS